MPAHIKMLVPLDGSGRNFLLRPGDGVREIPGLGVVDMSRLAHDGHPVRIAGKEFLVTDATLPDMLAALKRGAQIITSKDSAQIVMGCGIGPGMCVLEVGTGSGFLTVALAYFVGGGGRVVTYECNPKHAKNAASNIRLCGLEAVVELREADASTCQDACEYDAAVLDMPDPGAVLANVTRAMKPGARLCAYVPTMNQAEAAVKAMRESGYSDTHVLENMQREIVVGPGGTRPSFEMLGHTGYLCFGRKMVP